MISRLADKGRSTAPPPPRTTLMVLAALALTIVPHIAFQPPWISALCIALLAWRGAAELRRWRLPHSLLRLAAALLVWAGVFLSFQSLVGREAGSALLLALLALKLLETKSRRDLMVALFIGYFLCITLFLFRETPLTALWVTVAVVALTTALAMLQQADARIVPALRSTSLLLLQAAPLMLLLFLLFPRHTAPLWAYPLQQDASMTGLSEQMQPGSINQLVYNDAVAFRVDFDGEIPASSQLYWRGPVLRSTDGVRWFSDEHDRRTPAQPLQPRGEEIDYTVILEPHGQRWVLALDQPSQAGEGVRAVRGNVLLADAAITSRSRYRLRSALRWERVELSDEAWSDYLQLPDNLHPQSRALGALWATTEGSDAAVVARALRHFHDEPFYYSERPPLLRNDPVDQFLFDSRRGFCEHYAAAFVVLMRAAGIPSRVVTGYHGGEVNPLGNHLVVRHSDAHAWAEVWLEAEGWVRVDPTAAVPPERTEIDPTIQRIRVSAFASGGTALAAPRWQPQGHEHLLLAWDSLNHRWNHWVLGYDAQRQQDLYQRLGFDGIERGGMLTTTLLAIVAGLAVATLLLRRRWHWRMPWQLGVDAQWGRFCRRMARRGLPRRTDESAGDYATRIGAIHPEQEVAIREAARLYNRLRYGASAPPRAEQRQLRLLLRRIAHGKV